MSNINFDVIDTLVEVPRAMFFRRFFGGSGLLRSLDIDSALLLDESLQSCKNFHRMLSWSIPYVGYAGQVDLTTAIDQCMRDNDHERNKNPDMEGYPILLMSREFIGTDHHLHEAIFSLFTWDCRSTWIENLRDYADLDKLIAERPVLGAMVKRDAVVITHTLIATLLLLLPEEGNRLALCGLGEAGG